eukprot:CAMPEP_0173380742 /NCGR_PEP_ID=MMETSP1356-20130122/3373_1 /TAXON_ID=77927 ORGANISM="Hemiselmis virescens, Strain PCC157" /NCGR_SAMPLE_ID=MMETSP1356 /ASSEMBLY_ACC=CAM_ASM_000847 /LENGTH=739 /DNA_ID=CAMNT_0014334443 /DNA_START=165 /DNA_END=2384 /DNA_ORIENTATION=-
MPAELNAVATPNRSLTGTNCVYVNPEDLHTIGAKDNAYVKIKSLILTMRAEASVPQGSIAFNLVQRKTLSLSLNESLTVEPWRAPSDNVHVSKIVVEVDFPNKASQSQNPIDAQEVGNHITSHFNKHVFSVSQDFLTDFQGNNLTCRIVELEVVKGTTPPTPESLKALKEGDTSPSPIGIVGTHTLCVVTKGTGSTVNLTNVLKSSTSSKMFRPDFSFSKMGIGGLDLQIADIFRRAFASRVYPASVLAKMGLMHVRGVLLYGAPGCGKTLIARKIGKMLVDKEPKVVNGPEVLSKYVGQSEENVRNLFAEAKADMLSKGDESELHVIIFDELDAICKQRGTSRGDTGVGDSVVNQLLSYIDGVDALNNILIIGMTNRKDMLDEALLRPGRLEVHIEIGLPDEAGRVQILSIHTGGMKKGGFLDEGVSVDELAKMTKNYTGAEIEGVCKAAASYAFERNIDKTSMDKPADASDLRVMMEDFTRAIGEVKPAFGVSTEELEVCVPNGVLDYGERFAHILATGRKFLAQVRDSDNTPLLSVLVEGLPGAGKTALAASLAAEAEYPYTKLISAESLVNLSESAKCYKITKAFEDAYRSPLSVILLDNIERLVGYVKIGPRFSNEILQVLLVLIQRRPPKGHKLLVIGTTSNAEVLDQLELAGDHGCFNTTLACPYLNQSESAGIMNQLGCFDPHSISACAEAIDSAGIGIKQLLMVVEMAKQGGESKISHDVFVDCLRSYGL